jgi:hypothetical protein
MSNLQISWPIDIKEGKQTHSQTTFLLGDVSIIDIRGQMENTLAIPPRRKIIWPWACVNNAAISQNPNLQILQLGSPEGERRHCQTKGVGNTIV